MSTTTRRAPAGGPAPPRSTGSTWHSFSFGHHYDPADAAHGLLIVHNDDTVAPGRDSACTPTGT